jgi:uncharacterized Zn finger protein
VNKPHKSKPRKDYGSTWWGRAWLKPVESVCGEQVSSLGRSSALGGMVYDIDLKEGIVRAKAEGPHAEEYNVVIRFSGIRGKERRALFSLVSEPPVSLALLSNELPLSGESGGFDPLFGNYTSTCTCPKSGSPCMHVAAVFYALSGEIDYAPQILFFLRRISNDELLSCIRGKVR